MGTLEKTSFWSSSHTWVTVRMALLVACTEVGQKRNSREAIWGLWLTGCCFTICRLPFWNSQKYLWQRRKRAEVLEVQEEKQQELWVMDVNGTLFIGPDWEGLITFVLRCSSS